MNRTHCKALSIGLSAFLTAAQTLPGFSEALLIPRLGYPAQGTKRIYLDITTPDVVQATDKAKKEQEKALKKALSETRKAAEKSKPNAAPKTVEASGTTAPQKSMPEVTLADPPAGAASALSPENPEVIVHPAMQPDVPRTASKKHKQDKGQEKTDDKKSAAATEADREVQRKKAEIERFKRARARADARKTQWEQAPVDGKAYLHNLKLDRLVYREPVKIQPYMDKDRPAPGPYFVEFQHPVAEGLYDLAIQGSGHRSKAPIRISDDIYWQALQRVIQDIQKAHCPLDDGRHRILQQCAALEVQPASGTGTEVKSQVVTGGWYTDVLEDGRTVKVTSEVADLTQLLFKLYTMNPQSNKYLVIQGDSYAASALPDLLDEANWGIQYLLSMQQPDGSFPAGIEKTGTPGKEIYVLMPASPEATAHAITALATAVQVFKQDDLSTSVNAMRAAEKGWRYLQHQPVSPENLLPAALSLQNANPHPDYAAAAKQAQSVLKTVPAETVLLLPTLPEGLQIAGTPSPRTNRLTSLPGMLAQLQAQDKTVLSDVSQSVTDLFGYQRIALVRDNNLTVASAKADPLQWMATKAGDAITRFGDRIADTGLSGPTAKTGSARLQALEQKDQEARELLQEGYDKLSLTTFDRLYLAYALAMLNQNLASGYNPEVKKEKRRKGPVHAAPASTPKGFYPKLI